MMQLYNFLEEDFFNQLREQMQAPLIDESELPYNAQITYAELFDLVSGQELEIDQLEIDGHLFYHKGILVSLYIQDVYKDSLPKLHIALCKTLQEMKNGGRLQRYMTSCATHRHREIRLGKLSAGNSFELVKRQLDVCQNCLHKISWQGFGWHIEKQKRIEISKTFDLNAFYKNYQAQFYEDFIKNLPQQGQNLPINDYSLAWKSISYDYRKSKNWCCEQCGKDCQHQRGELHTHHINGLKHDNRLINLRALCYRCHAAQPFHEHMKKKVG